MLIQNSGQSNAIQRAEWWEQHSSRGGCRALESSRDIAQWSLHLIETLYVFALSIENLNIIIKMTKLQPAPYYHHAQSLLNDSYKTYTLKKHLLV